MSSLTIRAERALIGHLLVNPTNAPTVLPLVHAGDFYQPRHEILWDAATRLTSDGTTPDHLAVIDRPRADRTVDRLQLVRDVDHLSSFFLSPGSSTGGRSAGGRRSRFRSAISPANAVRRWFQKSRRRSRHRCTAAN